MRKLNKKQRIELISMLNGDRDTRIMTLQMCKTYMEENSKDSKFKQLYHKQIKGDKHVMKIIKKIHNNYINDDWYNYNVDNQVISMKSYPAFNK